MYTHYDLYINIKRDKKGHFQSAEIIDCPGGGTNKIIATVYERRALETAKSIIKIVNEYRNMKIDFVDGIENSLFCKG